MQGTVSGCQVGGQTGSWEQVPPSLQGEGETGASHTPRLAALQDRVLTALTTLEQGQEWPWHLGSGRPSAQAMRAR